MSPTLPTPRRHSLLTLVFLALLILLIFLNVTGIGRAVTPVVALAFAATMAVVAFRGTRMLFQRSIWALRNRLILNWLLIGVTPVVLSLVLVTLGGYIVAGQIAVFLVSSELDRRIQSLNEPAQILSWSTAESRKRTVNQMVPFVRNRFPRFQLLIHGDDDFRYPSDATLAIPPFGWKDASGIVTREGHYYTWSHVSKNTAEVLMLEPVTSRTLSELVPNLGAVHFFDQLQTHETDRVHIPPSHNRFDREVTWLAQRAVHEWDRPNETTPHLLMVTTRPSAVLAAVFGEKFELAQDSLYGFFALTLLFVTVEIGSWVAGISLSRTITGAVHNLYEGTRKVTSGDFSHRIDVKGNDQLADLSRSFNQMTQNLERLFSVEKEKERLQSELEIAKEVQNQLFPKDEPSLKTMSLTGLCEPARMVSGDYYDFLCLDEHRIALAIGDVAGKGISAALLMASIQSIMRTQLTAGYSSTSGHFCTSHAVTQLNKQLYASTAPEKYATFFFGVYDGEQRTFSYTNAGHLPPLLIRRGEATLLEVTGTVVGAFPMVRYEERTLVLEPGDMLIGYTDGVTEPENEYGEEYGTERLTEALLRHENLGMQEMIAKVMESVRQWTNAPELPDDMTLLVAKIQ